MALTYAQLLAQLDQSSPIDPPLHEQITAIDGGWTAVLTHVKTQLNDISNAFSDLAGGWSVVEAALVSRTGQRVEGINNYLANIGKTIDQVEWDNLWDLIFTQGNYNSDSLIIAGLYSIYVMDTFTEAVIDSIPDDSLSFNKLEAAVRNKIDGKLDATEVTTAATANKVLRLDANSKLPASITGDSASVGGKAVGLIAPFNPNGLWNFNRYLYNQHLGLALSAASDLALRGLQWDSFRNLNLTGTSGANIRARKEQSNMNANGYDYFSFSGHVSLNENPFKFLPALEGNRGEPTRAGVGEPLYATTYTDFYTPCYNYLSSSESDAWDHTVYYDLGKSTYIPTLNMVLDLFWENFIKNNAWYPRTFRIYGGDTLDTTPVQSAGSMTLLYQRDRELNVAGDELNLTLNIPVNASYRYIVLDLSGAAFSGQRTYFKFKNFNASGYTLNESDRDFTTTIVTMPSFNYVSIDLATIISGTYKVFISNDGGSNYTEATFIETVNFYVDANRRERRYTCVLPSVGTQFKMLIRPANYVSEHVVTGYNLFTTLKF